MATINLGRIKPVFRGAYAGGTAYVVDDIVTHGNETFICIQAGTGNATSNASYWTKLAAKGVDGSDGTDVGTTLTTQGDILYRDGSGLQRLPKGTAGQVLKMNAAANAPEYGTIASDYVKLAGNYSTSINNSNTISIDGYFSSTYRHYKLIVNTRAENNWIKMRFNQSGSAQSNTWYRGAASYSSKASGSTAQNQFSVWNADHFISHSYWSAANDTGARGEYLLYDPLRTDQRKMYTYQGVEFNGDTIYQHTGGGTLNDLGAVTGFSFLPNGGDFVDFGWTLYGIKGA